MNVPVGPTTVAGWGTALSAFAGAIIVYLTGDHSAQQITSIEIGGGGLLVGLFTLVGRYLQAHKLSSLHVAVPPVPVSAQAETLGGSESSV